MNTYIFIFNVHHYNNEANFGSNNTKEHIIFRLLANGMTLETLDYPLERTYILQSDQPLEYWIKIVVEEIQPIIRNHAENFFFNISEVAVRNENLMMRQDSYEALQDGFVAMATQILKDKLGA